MTRRKGSLCIQFNDSVFSSVRSGQFIRGREERKVDLEGYQHFLALLDKHQVDLFTSLEDWLFRCP